MKVRFFADDFNARFIWSWVDGEYITEDQAEIENLSGLGLRYEEVIDDIKEKVIEVPKRGRKKKAK